MNCHSNQIVTRINVTINGKIYACDCAPFRLAVLFYLPRMLWLMMEGGLMKFFGKGTTTRIIEDPEEKRDKLVEVCITN